MQDPNKYTHLICATARIKICHICTVVSMHRYRYRYLKKYTSKIIQKCAIKSEKLVKFLNQYVFYFLNQTRNCIQTFEVKKFFRDIKCRRDDLPETTYLPLGANATTLTPYLCPGNSDICCFSCTSHIRTHGACPHSPVTKYLQKNTKIS